MKSKILCKLLSCLILMCVFVSAILQPIYAGSQTTSINRFNVAIVLDASNSMNYTDPSGLRYEAISLFVNLLAEQGNYLGGIVFSNHVIAQHEPAQVSSQDEKNTVINTMQSVMSNGVTAGMGYTNIGEALYVAVESLADNGNRELPSVILFLSDGNTEMPTSSEQTASLDQKADAIQTARENNVSIYTVCLNANNSADISEMEQISSATGGVFQEVASADDLQNVFNTFYALIYGTSTINLVNDTFPSSGLLSTEFSVPGIGVEEVNIIINGNVSSIRLDSPDGSSAHTSQVSSELYTLVKMTDVVPGTWTLVTEGVSGESIQINMVYNTDLGVSVQIEPEMYALKPNDTLKVLAALTSGENVATQASQYTGYTASVCIMDAYKNVLTNLPMTLSDSGFETEVSFDEGTYFINVTVEGNHLERTSTDLGPIVADNANIGTASWNNTAPEAVENPVRETVFIWPLRGGSTSIDMSALAQDAQDSELVYQIVSSSFIEGEDYTVSGNTITIDNFSLSKGSFDILATDSGGLSCNIEVIVTSYNVGIMTLIGLGIAILIVIAILVTLFCIALKKPFRGSITVNGVKKEKRRGRMRLSVFGLESLGIDVNKSYFQATGEPYVYLVTNRPVIWNGQKTSKVRIQSGLGATVFTSTDGQRSLNIVFESRMKYGSQKPRTKSYSNRGKRR